jgi:nitrogen-specific signal transduction histidine kinase
MNIEKAVTEVKDRFEVVGQRAEKVAKTSLQTLKKANGIVVDGIQDLVQTQTEAAQALFEAGKESFEKARTDGLVAVASSPIEYLPEGRDTIVEAFNDSVVVVTKTGEKLVKVVKAGYETAALQIQGKPARKPKAKKARRTVRKAAAAPATVQAAA